MKTKFNMLDIDQELLLKQYLDITHDRISRLKEILDIISQFADTPNHTEILIHKVLITDKQLKTKADNL